MTVEERGRRADQQNEIDEKESRYWQVMEADGSASDKRYQMKDAEGKPAFVRPEREVSVDITFRVSGSGRRTDRQMGLRVARYRTSDREILELNGLPWEEPSALTQRLIDRFAHELTEEMKEQMPWDGEI